MKLWIDGDSCQRKAMEIALKIHGHQNLLVVVVADRDVPGVREKGAELIIVPHGSGDADELIVRDSVTGDIVLTRDFALGIRLIEKGLTVLNDRGKIWSLTELKSRAEEAEIMRALRNGGITGKAGRNYGPKETRDFAAALDHLINGLGKE